MTKVPKPEDVWERVKTLDSRLTHLERGGKGSKGIIDGAVNFYSEAGDLQLKVGKLEDGTVGVKRYSLGSPVDDVAVFDPEGGSSPVIGGPIGEGVEGLTATAGVRTIILQWDAIVDFENFSHYQVQIADDDTFSTVLRTGTTEATLFGWEPSGTPQTDPYWARVRAVDRHGGATEWSTAVSATLTGTLVSDDLADLMVEAEKLAEGAVSDPTKIANAAVGSAAIANLAVNSAHLDTVEINSAQVLELIADNILAGTLTAVVTVAGTIKTATSGERVEIDSSGLTAYRSESDAFTEGQFEWWREGMGDSDPFAFIYGRWETDIKQSTAVIRAQPIDSTYRSRVLLTTINDVGGEAVVVGLEWESGVNRWIDFWMNGNRRFGFFDGIRSATSDRCYLQGPVKIAHAGLIYDNALNHVVVKDVAAGDTVTVNVSYGTSFPSTLASNPSFSATPTGGTVAQQTARAHQRGYGGCSVTLFNHSSVTADLGVTGFPYASN